MAAVGMNHLVVAPISAEASNTITYGTGVIVEHVVTGDVTYNYDESDLYGDDMLAEHYKAMTSADIEIGITELDDAVSTLIGIEEASVSGTAPNTVTTYKLATANNTTCGVGFIQRLLLRISQRHFAEVMGPYQRLLAGHGILFLLHVRHVTSPPSQRDCRPLPWP